MIKPAFRILILLFCLVGLYILSSWFLLDGRITYWTSFNESTIANSKKKNLYVTENLFIQTQGDSLFDWQSKFTIWTNKRNEIKFFGFLFYWTYNDPSWRYLNVEPKTAYVGDKWFRSKLSINQQTRDYMANFSGGYESCCNRIASKQNDTVRIEFIQAFQKNNVLGTISIVVK